MGFKKMCFLCGARVDELKDGRCQKCFLKEVSPIKEIREVNFKICNMCRKIHYGNQLFDVEELKEKLPEILRKSVVMNKGYVLNSANFENFEIEGHHVGFDVLLDFSLDS